MNSKRLIINIGTICLLFLSLGCDETKNSIKQSLGIPKKEIGTYPNGTKKFERGYLNHLLEGPSTEYFQDGQVSVISEYKAGKLDGDVFSYTQSGTLMSKCSYSSDILVSCFNANSNKTNYFDEQQRVVKSVQEIIDSNKRKIQEIELTSYDGDKNHTKEELPQIIEKYIKANSNTTSLVERTLVFFNNEKLTFQYLPYRKILQYDTNGIKVVDCLVPDAYDADKDKQQKAEIAKQKKDIFETTRDNSTMRLGDIYCNSVKDFMKRNLEKDGSTSPQDVPIK